VEWREWIRYSSEGKITCLSILPEISAADLGGGDPRSTLSGMHEGNDRRVGLLTLFGKTET